MIYVYIIATETWIYNLLVITKDLMRPIFQIFYVIKQKLVEVLQFM